jgi:hypothetical protein
MGTRHLTVVSLNNEIKVAQYGQWDGYPTGAGKDIAEFLSGMISSPFGLNYFKKRVKDISWFTEKEIEEIHKICKGDILPALSRDTGSKILELIECNKIDRLQNSIDFAADSLFCEYLYFIDLDKEQVEIYKGFNKDKLTKKDRFFSIKPEKKSEYKQVKLWTIIPFKEFTDEAMEALEKSQRDD